MADLMSTPLELVGRILEFLDPPSIFHFSLVSRWCSKASKKAILKHVRFGQNQYLEVPRMAIRLVKEPELASSIKSITFRDIECGPGRDFPYSTSQGDSNLEDNIPKIRAIIAAAIGTGKDRASVELRNKCLSSILHELSSAGCLALIICMSYNIEVLDLEFVMHSNNLAMDLISAIFARIRQCSQLDQAISKESQSIARHQPQMFQRLRLLHLTSTMDRRPGKLLDLRTLRVQSTIYNHVYAYTRLNVSPLIRNAAHFIQALELVGTMTTKGALFQAVKNSSLSGLKRLVLHDYTPVEGTEGCLLKGYRELVTLLSQHCLELEYFHLCPKTDNLSAKDKTVLDLVSLSKVKVLHIDFDLLPQDLGQCLPPVLASLHIRIPHPAYILEHNDELWGPKGLFSEQSLSSIVFRPAIKTLAIDITVRLYANCRLSHRMRTTLEREALPPIASPGDLQEWRDRGAQLLSVAKLVARQANVKFEANRVYESMGGNVTQLWVDANKNHDEYAPRPPPPPPQSPPIWSSRTAYPPLEWVTPPLPQLSLTQSPLPPPPPFQQARHLRRSARLAASREVFPGSSSTALDRP